MLVFICLFVLFGILTGLIVGKFKGLEWGMGIGGFILSIGGLILTIQIGINRYNELKDAVTAKGILIDYTEEREVKSHRINYSPLVRFSTPDGKKYTIRGLGSNRKKWQIHDAIDVTYKPSDPNQGFITDFQNTWGLTWALSLITLFLLSIGIFFIGGKIRGTKDDTIKIQTILASYTRITMERHFTKSGNIVMLSSFVLFFIFFFISGTIVKPIGTVFIGIGLGSFILGIGQWLSPVNDWELRTIPFVIGVFFFMIGLGAVLLG
ncbi:DUF3592 domain-containing protein [Leptospira interrogans]|uniref:DUF3592 domain-containing protein n=6 Tax=Leptospira interrogans TaxID=173 RepID=A0AAV9FQZ7_LEPIR|nr:DUF3592 domain-containing protein [Leptospira interrogans]APH40981.1 PF12158 family protein [Leptospira interrogans serovar Copenhageni/Icterohaemorrhagiae]EMG20123.1 PF12158 family protein [Leptospira interrogans serovar Copenhageni str. LT2050]EMY03220.1 PF12158 family protein [Leptospira interrogans str. 2002000626]AAS69662.1 hypothetical protein LIC_11055 [Leptospira interrogans serovar Copenhageni str. Fiocruz L1-130]ALE40273.1 hypothetical protein G436_3112 [Leptospira interrogans ser